jgi:transcriptional regulator with XRE-family HTH domain
VSNQFGNKIRELREQQKLLLRQVAPLLDVDTPMLSKIERGERQAKKELVLRLAPILKAMPDELLTLWLADQIAALAADEEVGLQAMQVAEKEVKYQKTKKKK